jgi:phosphatidate phosphatase APP1
MLTAVLCLGSILVAAPQAGLRTNLSTDEQVQLFPTFAWQTTTGWTAEVHGWVYELEENSLARRMLIGSLRRAAGLKDGDTETAIFRERAQSFLVDNESDKHLLVRIGTRVAALPQSEPNGHFVGRVVLPAAVGTTPDPWLPVVIVTKDDDPRRFAGRVQLIPPTGLSVISDIDDTIKVSGVHSKRALLRNTLLEEFKAVPGMAALYERLKEHDVVFHYVSASPWQLYSHLEAFLKSAGFPQGTFHLQDFRWKDVTALETALGAHHSKQQRIQSVMDRYPNRQFILIGDSGQKDPEMYGALYRESKGEVVRILIRDVTGEPRSAARYTKSLSGVPADRWTLFTDPATIRLKP